VGTRCGVVMDAGYLVGGKGVRAWAVVGASVVGVRVRSATSPFRWVTMGLGGVQTGWAGVTGLASGQGAGVGLAKGDQALVERKSLVVGTGPMEVLVSVAQSIRARSYSYSNGLAGVLAMVSGAGCVVSSTRSRIPCNPLPTSA
jgi:hypothetical protein